jgi:hypothetical protein
VQYPQLVRRLIVASLAYRNDGFHPDTAAQLWNRHRWVKIGRERAVWRGPVHG